jgi:hypothetical protein
VRACFAEKKRDGSFAAGRRRERGRQVLGRGISHLVHLWDGLRELHDAAVASSKRNGGRHAVAAREDWGGLGQRLSWKRTWETQRQQHMLVDRASAR